MVWMHSHLSRVIYQSRSGYRSTAFLLSVASRVWNTRDICLPLIPRPHLSRARDDDDHDCSVGRATALYPCLCITQTLAAARHCSVCEAPAGCRVGAAAWVIACVEPAHLPVLCVHCARGCLCTLASGCTTFVLFGLVPRERARFFCDAHAES